MLNQLLWKIKKFIRDYSPVICVVCHGIFFNKDTELELNTIGNAVPLCSKCHDELFTPFSVRSK